MKIWAGIEDGNLGKVAIPETAVCDNHKPGDLDQLFVDCSENEELQCQVCGTRSSAYLLRTAKLIVQDATAEIEDLEKLAEKSQHTALGAIAMLNCNLARMVYTLAKCVEQLARDQV